MSAVLKVAPVPEPVVDNWVKTPPTGLDVKTPAAVMLKFRIPIVRPSLAPASPPPVTGSAVVTVGLTV